MDLPAKVREHPIFSALATVLATVLVLGSIWALFSNEPPLPAIYKAAAAVVTMNTIAVAVVVVAALVPITLFILIVAGAVYYKREAERQAANLRAADEELRDSVTECQRVAHERDDAVNALKRDKTEFGHAMLRWHSWLTFKDQVKPIVTIRSAAYGDDYGLVQQIETIIKEDLGWTVTLDGTNDPMLPQAGNIKVIFESGNTLSFDGVALAFSAGDLLGVPVGTAKSDRADYNHLVIKVLPSASA